MSRTKVINKARRRTPGKIKIVRQDGLILEMLNKQFEEPEIKAMLKTQDNKKKLKILQLINRHRDDPNEYRLKRAGGQIILIHEDQIHESIN